MKKQLSLAAVAALSAPVALGQFVTAEYENWPNVIGVDDAEFTPDGRYLVIRDNTQDTSVNVYDTATGQLVLQHMGQVSPQYGGACEDAVATTDDFAVVIGTSALFVDLTVTPPVVFAEHNLGFRPRDLEITPDGTKVAIRGDDALWIFDLGTGTPLASAVGQAPAYSSFAFEVDSVAVTNEHAVFTSWWPGSTTRVTIFELNPQGGGPPIVVHSSTPSDELEGIPHDVAISPSGQFATVRSENNIALYDLWATPVTQVWKLGNFDDFGNSAMDSVAITDEMVATICRRTTQGTGGRIFLYDMTGNVRRDALLSGDPHDIALNPAGDRVIARTHNNIYMFPMTGVTGTGFILPIAEANFAGDSAGYQMGLDSLAVTDQHVVTTRRNGLGSKIRVYDISQDTFEGQLTFDLPTGTTDVAATPSGDYAAVSSLGGGAIIDLRTLKVTLEYDIEETGVTPWSDGIAIRDDMVALTGVRCCFSAAFDGFVAIVDLFSDTVSYCPASANSTGMPGELFVTGSSRESENDLRLTAQDLPAGRFGRFMYGDTQTQVPWGAGTICVSGQAVGFDVQTIGPAGRATLEVDNMNLPGGGGQLLAGSTWNFQFVFRDAPAGNPRWVNLTNAVQVMFE